MIAVTRQNIKQAALNLLAAHGYEKTTLSAIAKEVGIKAPSIYSFFESKEALFVEIYRDLLDEHFMQLKQLITSNEGKAPEKRLKHLLKGILSYHVHHPKESRVLLQLLLFPPEFMQDEIERLFIEKEEMQRKLLMEIFTDAMNENVVRKQAMDDLIASFFCLMDGLFLELFYYGEDVLMGKLEQIWQVYWTGLTTS
ncbi:TetR/AcrR family transcriptional regulator [Novibacillus thermophilus]|uniref:TetR/AcrR family transcriptional regulator n=1 Tax=Novibacillus thermophilus TaxID=1471761 RepID=UPI00098B97CC|nr:TetR/AcrR family transcriptional regulator [Novibacillus thermophilus]